VNVVRERAYAKLNLVLRVGRPRHDGLHPICSILASIDLADDVFVEPADTGSDSVECPGVDGPNIALAALVILRRRVPALPPLRVRILKRIPVAAGLAGGSADAAAVLRAANRIAGEPLDAAALREIAAGLGSDVPAQVQPRHALVTGVGELVEPLALPPLAAVLAPQAEGLSAAEVYAQLDRMDGGREELREDDVRGRASSLVDGAPAGIGAVLENDLQPAALALRPELGVVLDRLRAAGAVGTLVSGSGPTCFGVFEDRRAAEDAASAIPGAVLTDLRSG
jgi:4-diphosphocytidyl-2-C-methyl-D-erythritol kinase